MDTACALDRAPSLASNRPTWDSTVLGEMASSRPIVLVGSPRASAARTSASLGGQGRRPDGRRGRVRGRFRATHTAPLGEDRGSRHGMQRCPARCDVTGCADQVGRAGVSPRETAGRAREQQLRHIGVGGRVGDREHPGIAHEQLAHVLVQAAVGEPGAATTTCGAVDRHARSRAERESAAPTTWMSGAVSKAADSVSRSRADGSATTIFIPCRPGPSAGAALRDASRTRPRPGCARRACRRCAACGSAPRRG